MRCRGSGTSGGLATPGRVTNRAGSGTGWEAGRNRVTAPYAKPVAARQDRIPSTAGHEEPGGKQGGPPPRLSTTLRPTVDEYREGKVKSTPRGE